MLRAYSLLCLSGLALGLSPKPSAGKALLATAPGKKARIAHCFTGGMRTFNRPEVYKSIADNMTANGDVFIAMYTGFEISLRAGLNRATVPELENALNYLKPKDIKLHSQDTPHRELMYTMWENCADMVEKYEKKMGFKYDIIFRGRPDHRYQCKPDYLQDVVRKFDLMRNSSVLITMEDQIHVFNRNVLKVYHGIQERIAKVNQSTACPSQGRPLGATICVQLVPFREHGINKFIETKGEKDVCNEHMNFCEEKGTFNRNIMKIVRDFDSTNSDTLHHPDMGKVVHLVGTKLYQISVGIDETDIAPISTGRSCNMNSNNTYHCSNCAAHIVSKVSADKVHELLKKTPPCADISTAELVKEATQGGHHFSNVSTLAAAKANKKWFCSHFPKTQLCTSKTGVLATEQDESMVTIRNQILKEYKKAIFAALTSIEQISHK